MAKFGLNFLGFSGISRDNKSPVLPGLLVFFWLNMYKDHSTSFEDLSGILSTLKYLLGKLHQLKGHLFREESQDCPI